MAAKCFPLALAGTTLALAPFWRRIEGREHLPTGAAILAANHASFLDGVLLGCMYGKITALPLHTISIASPFKHAFWGWCLKCAQSIPYERGDPDAGINTLASAIAWLKRGEAVGIFPEAHVGAARRLRRFRPGAALLALETGAPLVPVGILGSGDTLPIGAKFPRLGRHIVLRIGEPFACTDAHREYHKTSAERRITLVHEVNRRLGQAISTLCGKEAPK